MNFNWRTDDEQSWDPEIPSHAASTARANLHRWRPLLILVLLLSTGAFVAWRGLQARIERTRQALEQDVRASHALAARAIQSRDTELLTAVLSGRDSSWSETQRRLLQADLLAAGALGPFGFDSGSAQTSPAALEWSPDLQTAYVTNQITTTAASGVQSAGAPVALRQISVYRRGTDRWLLSPPDAEFWGPWQLLGTTHVMLSFRQRDAETAREMLPVLDRAVAELCRTLGHPCPSNAAFRVRLDPDGETLRRLRNDRFPTFRFGELSLPSPTLVGQPQDNHAADLLHRSYAHYLLIAVAQELLGFDCCQGAQFMDALAARVAHDLGYGPSPLQSADYGSMIDDLQRLGQFNRLWWGAYRTPFTTEDRAQVAAFIAFLSRHSGASYPELQRALSEAFGFWDWVQPFVHHDVVAQRDELEAAWRGFVLAQANAAQSSLLDAPAPAQTLALLCEDNAGQRAIYDYDPQTDQWGPRRAASGRAPAVIPTPGDDGLVLFDRVTADPGRLPARLLIDDREIPLDGELAPAYSLPADPQGEYMPMWRVSQSGRTVDGPVLLDLSSCRQTGRCRERSLLGLPSWSPSGDGLVIWNSATGRLTLRSRDFYSGLDTGIHSSQPPFWLDEETVVFVAEDGASLQVVRFAPGEPQEPRPLLILQPVLEALGRAGDGRAWRFAQTYPVPGSEAIVGAITLPESGARHYFLARFDGWQLPVDVISLSYAPQLTVTSPEALISGKGEWLSLHLYPETLQDARFVLHDLRTGAIVLDTRSPYFTAVRAHDWSAGGQWLARIGPYYVELLTAGHDDAQPLLRRFVSTGQLQCTSVAWQNR